MTNWKEQVLELLNGHSIKVGNNIFEIGDIENETEGGGIRTGERFIFFINEDSISTVKVYNTLEDSKYLEINIKHISTESFADFDEKWRMTLAMYY